jgi:hypothetical protein
MADRRKYSTMTEGTMGRNLAIEELMARTGRVQASVARIERDTTDDLIAALVLCRHTSMSRAEATAIVNDCYDVVYSDDSTSKGSHLCSSK